MPSSPRIRSTHEVPERPLPDLVEHWSAARLNTLTEPNPDDLFAELAYCTHIATVALSGRWCAVAALLRLGAIDSWHQVGPALGMTGHEARDGFHRWITTQRQLRADTGMIGLTTTDADELSRLSGAVTW